MIVCDALPKFCLFSTMHPALSSFSKILQPVAVNKPTLGNIIATNQPDVEVMAMVLKDTPISMAGYHELEGGRGWFNMPFMILSVGPSGFAKVPYTASKKKGEKEANPQNLYETMADGNVKLFSYEPGRTNKDKGQRKHEGLSEDGQPCDLTTVLAPGMCLTQFTRPENYEDNKFIVCDGFTGVDKLPAYSVVYMQLSSSNSEQAIKGRLLKVRKIKVMEPATVSWQSCLKLMPSTENDFKQLNAKDTHYAIRENIESRSGTVFTQIDLPCTAFTDMEDDKIVVCDVAQGVDIALMSETVVEHILPLTNIKARLKFLNIAIATGAVKVLLRANPTESFIVLDGSTDKYPHRIVGMDVDYNKMFGFDLLSVCNFKSMFSDTHAVSTPHLSFYYNGRDTLFWHKNDTWPDAEEELSLVFSFNTTLQPALEDGALSNNFVDKGGRQAHFKLNVHAIPREMNLETLAEQVQNEELDVRPVLVLEVRPANRTSSSTGSKRKRPAMEFEDDEMRD